MAVWSTTNVREITKSKRIDSEFFHPKYLLAETLVNSLEDVIPLGQIGKFKIGPFGSAFHVKNYDKTSEYRYIRGKDVKPFQLLNDDNVYMPEKDFIRLSKYAVQEDDLLISVVGTLGNVAIVPDDVKGIFSCKSTIFRDSTVLPTYLLAYFNTKYGKECLLRRQRGAVQTGLNKEDLKTVPVPVFNDEIQKQIGGKVKKAISLERKSQYLYQQATALLEKELGLDIITFEKPTSYTSSFSEVVNGSRLDADYFQPMYNQLLNRLSKFELRTINYLSDKLETGVYSPSYSSKGVDYIRGTNISADGTIKRDDLLKTNVVIPTIQNTAIKDDILVTRVGSIGVCGIVLSENISIYSDNLIRIRIRESNKNLISAKYILLFLQSRYGQMLMTKYSGGSVQQRLNQSMLNKIPIPVISYSKQLEIEELYVASIKESTKSKQLLEQAKYEVEELIEAAGTK
jgi:type I restriction enzyme S subunit